MSNIKVSETVPFGTQSEVENPITGCYSCDTIMTREWRHDLPDKCLGTKQDCGDCLAGYYAHKDGEKCSILTSGITVKNHQTTFLPNGASVIIPCLFNENVDCVWQRRGQHVAIGNRYQLKIGNGLRTKDCSIQIAKFNNNIDYGEWTCESMADSSSNSKTQVVVNLSNERVKTIKSSYKTAHVKSEDTIILNCHFNETRNIDCAWTRNENHLDISGRYSYLNSKGSDTKDCTIKISKVKQIDFGIWHCESMADSRYGAMHATDVKLIQVQPPSLRSSPENVTAFIGDNAVLNCLYDANVVCNWKHNQTEPLTSKEIYSFTEKDHFGERRICSVKIENVKHTDAGEWTCNYEGSPFVDLTKQSIWLTVQPKSKIVTTPAMTGISQEVNSNEILKSKGTVLEASTFLATFTLIFALIYTCKEIVPTANVYSV